MFSSVLQRMERLFQVDMHYLARGTFWSGAGQTIGMFASLITAYAFANYVPTDVYGTYKYILATAALLAIPTLSGMNTAVLQAVARNRDGTALSAILMRIRWGTIGAVAGILLGSFYLLRENETLGYAFILIGILLPFSESLITAQAVFMGKQEFGTAARYSALNAALTAGSIVSAILLDGRALSIIAAYAIATLLGRIITFNASRSLLKNSEISSESISFGVHASVAGAFGIIATNADIFILWHGADADSLALYAFALAVVTPFQSFVKSIANLAHPKFSVQDGRMLSQSVPRRARQSLLILIPGVFAGILLMPIAFSVLFPAYQDSVPFAQALLLTLLLYPEKLYSIALSTKQHAKSLYILNAFNTTTHIILLLVLVPLYGAWGAVCAVLAQNATAAFATRVAFYRLIPPQER